VQPRRQPEQIDQVTTLRLIAKGKSIASFTQNLVPGSPLVKEIRLAKNIRPTDLQVEGTYSPTSLSLRQLVLREGLTKWNMFDLE
jgi:hypothetical protein